MDRKSKSKPFKMKSQAGVKAGGFKMMGGESPNKILGLFKNKDKEAAPAGAPDGEKKEESKGKKIMKKLGAGALGAVTGALDAVYGSGKIVKGPRVSDDEEEEKPEEETKDDKKIEEDAE